MLISLPVVKVLLDARETQFLHLQFFRSSFPTPQIS